MKVPLSWLKEFVFFEMDPFTLAERLTMRGLEVESIEKREALFSDVVVGQIINMEKPKGLDHLILVDVDIGKERLPILCGAKNIKLGDKVPVAKIGARLADGRRIEKRKIKGIDSLGMLCSERELGVSDDHSGIFILSPNVEIGRRLEEVEGIRDFIFDINVTPNRGDCLSVLGIAREVGSILGRKVRLPEIELVEEDEEIEDYVSLEVIDKDACPRYILRMLKDTSIVPSPFWMRNRISLCGMRPINSIVDVTNYVMLEIGQPLHAFDYERIRKNSIIVRVLQESMHFRTLDGEERLLLKDDLLICDGDGPVAIAGIMGGENSEIRQETKHVLLESAFFNPIFIGRTARRLNLKSEASLRFEKGIDIGITDYAAKRAISLMKEIAGGRIVKGKKEARKEEEERTVSVFLSDLERMIGVSVGEEKFLELLDSIEFDVKKADDSSFTVQIPSFRPDVKEFMDIVEEVARLYGYNLVPSTMPRGVLRVGEGEKKYRIIRAIKEFSVSAGFFEVINFAFFSKKDIENFLLGEGDSRKHYVSIINPISKEQEIMRTFLLPGLLNNMAFNINRGTKNLRIFEVGKIFLKTPNGQPSESLRLAFAVAGKEREYFWRDKVNEYDFFDIKGVIEAFFERFHLGFSIVKGKEPFLLSDSAADLLHENEKIGYLGEIKEEVLRRYEMDQRVYVCEIDLQKILDELKIHGRYRHISKFPPVIRDFSFYVEDEVPVSLIIEKIKDISPLVVSADIFDVFRKEKRSIAIRVIFQSLEETLKEEHINRLQETIIKKVTEIEGVELRG